MARDPQALLQEADRLMSGASGGKLFSFFGGGREDKYQDAADRYIEAANAFKMQNRDREAGQAFEKAADVHTRYLNELDDAANALVDAFTSYKTSSPQDAVRCINIAINRYCVKGSFTRAARRKKDLAELFEAQPGERANAVESYETAARWYDRENQPGSANPCWIKAADIASQDQGGQDRDGSYKEDLYYRADYPKAIEIYERLAQSSIKTMNSYRAKECFLKAGICHLAIDPISMRREVQKYQQMDTTVPRDGYQLLEDLCAAVVAKDKKQFEGTWINYRKTPTLDQVAKAILVKIGEKIVKADDADDADNEFA